MKKVQFLMALLLGTVAAAHSARGQTSVQRLSFSVFGQYQTNELTTHSSRTATNRITTEVAKSVEISSDNILKAIAIDEFGAGWINLTTASLVRETDFANGHSGAEGIFLYRAWPPTNVNVSSHFSFTNNFTSGVTNNFPAVTNFNFANPVHGGTVTLKGGGSLTNTNSLTCAGLFYVSLYTTNIQFNLIGYGTTTTTDLTGSIHRTNLYSGEVQSLQAACVGSFGLYVGTNLFGTNVVSDALEPTNFVSGPAHGSFGAAAPFFITNAFGE